MSQNKETFNNIEIAIKYCAEKNQEHKIEGQKVFRLIILIVISFIASILFPFFINSYFEYKMEDNLNSLNIENVKLESILTKIKYNTNYLNSIQLSYDTLFGFQRVHSKEYEKYFSDTNGKSSEIDSLMKYSNGRIRSIISNADKTTSSKIDSNIFYIIYGLFILIFGVLTSFYRFHLKETAKYEHFLLGFYRIRIAGDNSNNGFESEVRQSLTLDAFLYENNASIFKKQSKIESPIPGHPTADLSALLFEKILDTIEVTLKPKGKVT